MKRILSFFFSSFVLFYCHLPLSAQEGSFGPVNPHYLKFLEQQKDTKGIQGTASNQGYVPSPLLLNFDLMYPDNPMELNSKGEPLILPARFDLRDSGFISPVKDQVVSGPCWAFASMASIESRWLMRGLGEYDLSEQQLASCNGQTGYTSGGSAQLTSNFFSRLAGPVLETDCPYNHLQTNCIKKKYSLPFKVLSSEFLPPTPNVIKRHIMKYGPVVSTVRIENDTLIGSNIHEYRNHDDYYNNVDHTLYYPGTKIADHSVAFIGWDDNKVVTGGPKSPEVEKGAWIVKNSWGDQWGENGFFYVSYYDHAIFSEAGIFGDPVNCTEIDTAIVYDTYGPTGSYGFQSNDCFGLTKFSVPAPQVVKKIGTFIMNAATTLDVEIYEKFSNDTLSGLLFSRSNIFCEFPGEKTIDVNARVNGDYYVKVHYHTIFSQFPISIQKAGDVSFVPVTIKPAGYNWVSPDGQTWQPLGSSIANGKLNLTIRSYNIFAENEVAGFSLEKEILCLYDSIRVIATYSGMKPQLNWTAGPDAGPVKNDGADTVYVRFTSPGKKSIRLIAGSGEDADTLTRQLEVVGSFPLTIASLKSDVTKMLPYGNYYLPAYAAGNTIVLYALTDADSIRWSDPWKDVQGPLVETKTEQEGMYQFHATAYQSGCVSGDTIRIYVKPYLGPSNDSIRNAIALSEGINGPFTNLNATVEAFEPFPPGTDCNTQTTWCGENGLQNSVWFTFQAPPSGIVSITSTGFDNQLAVYSSPDADSLIRGNYKLLAANDDFSFFNPAIRNLKNLVPGERYFLQMDGSNLGASGTCPIYLYYDQLFAESSRDTLFLDREADSWDSLTITTNGFFTVSGNRPWFTCSQDTGTKTATITVTAIDSNFTNQDRSGILTLNQMNMFKKSIVVVYQYHLPQGSVPKRIASGFNFFPNPVTSGMNIENNSGMKSRYAIFDIGGRSLISGELDPGMSTIDLRSLPRGLYLLHLGNRDGNLIEKFIKE
jgi:C1A family cysteine protease